jgi:hypothetical protein
MTATKIADAFQRWHELWTAKYPGDIPDADKLERLQPQAISWEDLPPETFKNQGTGVRAVLLVIEPWAEAQGRLL